MKQLGWTNEHLIRQAHDKADKGENHLTVAPLAGCRPSSTPADQILVVEDGRPSPAGSLAAELMAQGGLYRRRFIEIWNRPRAGD